MSSLGASGDVYAETLAVFDRRDDPYEPLTTPEVAESLDAARRTVYKRLEKLVGRGELKTKKAGANARVWWRPSGGASPAADADDGGPRRSEPGSTVEATSVDVTEHKSRERELEESRNRYQTLVEHFPNGAVALVDQELRYTTIGGTPLKAANATAAELEGKPVAAVLPPELADRFVPRYADALDGNGSTFEGKSDGRTYQFQILPIRDDDGRVFAAMGMSQDVTERKQREEELAALNRLNQVFQKVTDAVIDSSSREEIERTITGHLTDTDSYEYAWIGHLGRRGENVVPQTAESTETGLPLGALSIETDGPTSHRTIGEAIRTGTVQVAYDSVADPVFERWNRTNGSGHSAVASIPITFEERVYGVLTVYTGRENAFDENERRIIAGLGEVVGHAINSLERKRALLEDRVTEITFRSRELTDTYVDAVGEDSCTISIEKSVVLAGGQTISYYSLDGMDPEVYIDVIEDVYPGSEGHVVTRTGSRSRVEVKTTDATLASRLATLNSWIASGKFEDGAFSVTVRGPSTTDVRAVLDLVRDVYPDANVVAQTEVEREDANLGDVVSELDDRLTERQRTTLEVAYYSGFFDWPRAITGEELAERLDVTPGTVSHHLRHGERKLVAGFFESTA